MFGSSSFLQGKVMGRESREQRVFLNSDIRGYIRLFIFAACYQLMLSSSQGRTETTLSFLPSKVTVSRSIRASLSGWTSESRSRNILLH